MNPFIERSAGVLLHVTSLPGATLGGDARRFLDFLEQAGMRVWQMLPVGPPAQHDNPFDSLSAFAGNRRLLPPRLRIERAAVEAYRDANADWLDDWALFAALLHEQRHAPWWDWPAALRHRDPAALAAARRRLATAIEREVRAQCAFDSAWAGLRREAGARGIRIFGDVPLFVSRNSADVWARRELFEVDAEGRAEATVGVPPDAFSEDGQSWGFPPYRWSLLAQSGFAWWKRRFEVQARRFDFVRLDHFRGLAAWWRVPGGASSAREGAWITGPGAPAIACLQPVLHGAQLVAEDLGVITPDVIALRQDLGIPGMRVLQFAFDGNPHNEHLPRHHGPDTVCYTGTHDNDTTLGWWNTRGEAERDCLRRELGQPHPELPRALIDAAWASPAPLAIVPMQDLLALGSEARMNRPGIAQGNWNWRFEWDAVTPALAASLRAALWAAERG